MSDSLEQAEASIRAGQPRDALKHLTAAVRELPANKPMRIFLAQLLCVLGEWERAHTQLNVIADMDSSTVPMREMTGHALRCELLRKEVFAGKRAPMVFGQPPEWLALLIESLLQGEGSEQLADDLYARAMDAAPAMPGTLDGKPFEWIADGDSRLGPVLEAIIDGRYYWLPFENLSQIRFEEPADLQDLVWLPAYLTFQNGGESVGLIPTRYPGSESSDDPAIVMARKTDWRQLDENRWMGLGQRVLVTDQGEYDLLSVREINLVAHG